jgi:hypothetical protein
MNGGQRVVSIRIGNLNKVPVPMLQPRKLFAFVCGALLVLPAAVWAAPSATAVLSNSDVVVGEMVQLELRLSDAGSESVASEIKGDGLVAMHCKLRI